MKSNCVTLPPAVDEIEIFDNDDNAVKHSERKELRICGLVIIIIHQQQEAFVTQFDSTSFSSWLFKLVFGRYFLH